jgi:hypothetical protein
MLEKIPGYPRIDKLRVIHLFEADLNLIFGIIWGRRLIKHCEYHGALGEEQWGCRSGRSSEDVLLLKTLTYMLIRLTRTPAATFDNDAKACFDRIVLLFAILICRAYGLSVSACKMFVHFLQTVLYCVKTAAGLSETKYKSTPDNYLHGPGQGSREGPALWTMISATLMALMPLKARGITFSDPRWEIFTHRTMDGFVDDTTAWLNFFLESIEGNGFSMETMQQELTATAQWWEELLVASGGKLELPKCFYYIIQWTFDKYGDPVLGPDPILPITITDHTTKTTTTVKQKLCSKAHRTLGVMKTPGEDNEAQFNSLCKKAKNIANLVTASSISRHEGRVLHRSMYKPSISYGLSSVVLTKKQIHIIQTPAISALMSAMGYNQNMP